MKISVIIPCYNEENTIETIIDAVINSKCSIEKEIIIVDDFSKDKSISLSFETKVISYEDTAYGFRFEFYRGHKDPELLNENEDRILELIVDDPDIKVNELANKSSLSPRTVARIIAKLKKLGKIERQGSNKNGKWFLL